MTRAVLTACLIAGALEPALAQERVAFEVASVKLIAAREALGRITAEPKISGDRIAWVADAGMIIRYAYDIRFFQLQPQNRIVGTYEIQTKADGALTEERTRLMFQDLLRERFSLKFHWETKELLVYTVSIAPGGPKLTPWKERTEPWRVNSRLAAREGLVANYATSQDPHHLVGHKVPVRALADYLADALQKVVLDKTGLTGDFDFELTWNSFERPLDPPDPAIVSAAMQRQLGLRLDAGRGPVGMFAIDRLEQPSAN